MVLGMWFQLKARKLEELAAQIKSDRAKHDNKGKQVESSKMGEIEKINGEQKKNNDGENSGGIVAPIDQEKLDELCVPPYSFHIFLPC